MSRSQRPALTPPPAAPGAAPVHLGFPVTETGSDAAGRNTAAPEPSPVASGPAAGSLSVSVLYYVGGQKLVTPLPGAARMLKE